MLFWSTFLQLMVAGALYRESGTVLQHSPSFTSSSQHAPEPSSQFLFRNTRGIKNPATFHPRSFRAFGDVIAQIASREFVAPCITILLSVLFDRRQQTVIVLPPPQYLHHYRRSPKSKENHLVVMHHRHVLSHPEGPFSLVVCMVCLARHFQERKLFLDQPRVIGLLFHHPSISILYSRHLFKLFYIMIHAKRTEAHLRSFTTLGRLGNRD